MNDIIAQKTIRDYCCAACWGHLLLFADPVERWRIECPNCGAGKGFVTKRYAVRRLAESLGDKMDASQMLQQIGVIQNPNAGKSTKQLLKELGF